MHPASLPPLSRMKYDAIRADADDNRALLQAALVRRRELEAEAARWQQRLDAAPPADTAQRGEIAATLDAVTAELQRVAAQQSERAERRANAERLAAALRDWLERQPVDTALRTHPTRPPSLEKDDGYTSALARVRSEIAAAKGEVEQARAAPLPKSELKREARRYVERLAKLGRPSITAHSGTFDISWQLGLNTPISQMARLQELGPVNPALATLAWLDTGTMIRRLEQEIDALPQHDGIASPDRPRALARITEHLLDLERSEEALVGAALEAGVNVQRRPDASPVAVLGLHLAVHAPNAKDAHHDAMAALAAE